MAATYNVLASLDVISVYCICMAIYLLSQAFIWFLYTRHSESIHYSSLMAFRMTMTTLIISLMASK